MYTLICKDEKNSKYKSPQKIAKIKICTKKQYLKRIIFGKDLKRIMLTSIFIKQTDKK
jgi:hypothetical protein